MVQNVWKDPFLALSRMWSNSSTCSSFSGSFSRHSYCRYGSSERRSGMMEFTSMSLWRSEWHLRSAFFSLSSIRALILARCTVYLTKYTFSSYGGGCLGLYIMLHGCTVKHIHSRPPPSKVRHTGHNHCIIKTRLSEPPPSVLYGCSPCSDIYMSVIRPPSKYLMCMPATILYVIVCISFCSHFAMVCAHCFFHTSGWAG